MALSIPTLAYLSERADAGDTESGVELYLYAVAQGDTILQGTTSTKLIAIASADSGEIPRLCEAAEAAVDEGLLTSLVEVAVTRRVAVGAATTEGAFIAEFLDECQTSPLYLGTSGGGGGGGPIGV